MKFYITKNLKTIQIENKLYRGDIFVKSQCKIKPDVKLPLLYTTIIYDESSKFPDYIHLLIINNTNTILNYEPPNPPPKSGKHKYHVCIYKQKERLNFATTNRYNFDTSEFIYNKNLSIIDCTIFKVMH